MTDWLTDGLKDALRKAIPSKYSVIGGLGFLFIAGVVRHDGCVTFATDRGATLSVSLAKDGIEVSADKTGNRPLFPYDDPDAIDRLLVYVNHRLAESEHQLHLEKLCRL